MISGHGVDCVEPSCYIYIYIQFDPHVIHTVQLLGATKAAEPPDQSIKVNPHGYNGRFELRFVNDMADANQTKFILKWFTFDSSLVFHQWMPVLHASLDSRSQQLSDGAGQSMMAKFLFNEIQFPSILGTVLLFLFTYVSPRWQMWDPIEVTLTRKKKHARDDSWICAGAIEPSILEASHT